MNTAIVLDAAPYSEEEEAVYAVASACRDTDDLQCLLEMLGLNLVFTRWTVPRIQRRILECGCGMFTSAVMRHFVPRRARRLFGTAFSGLLSGGLIRDTGLVRDGLCCYELTSAGKDLAACFRPEPSHEVILFHSTFASRAIIE